MSYSCCFHADYHAEIHAVPVIHADIHAVIHAVAFHAVDYHAVSCQLHGKRMAAEAKQHHTHADIDMRAPFSDDTHIRSPVCRDQ